MRTTLLIVLNVFCLGGILAQTLDWNAIDLSNTSTVSGKINGFNMGGYAYGHMNIQSNNVTVPTECSECSNSILIDAGPSFSSMQTKQNVVTESAKLKPGVLRFPGGTHSGWYHLYEYDNQGFYDASSPQIDKGYGMTAIEAGHLGNPFSYCRLDSRLTVNENFIDGFINYLHNVQNATNNSKKIEVTYVANLLTHFRFQSSQNIFSNCGRTKATTPMSNYNCSSQFTYTYVGNEALFNNDPDVYRFELYYKETQDAIDRLVSSLSLDSSDVLYVEMGNEYYSSDGYPYLKYEMDVNDYSELVEIYSERLNCYFSNKVNLKIGVVTKPNTPWNTGLVNNLGSDLSGDGTTLDSAINAVIYHDYYNKSFCLNETDISTRFDCAKDALRNHIEIDLTSNLDILQASYPNQNIWITEWNVLKGDNDKNNSYINTILHASFVQEYALSVLEYNKAHNNAVSMLAHHRLGDHNVWSVIQTKDGDNSEANYRSGAYPMQYISKLYEYESISFKGNILTSGPTLFDTKEAKIMAFAQYQDGNNPVDKVLLYFTNKTNSAINFSIPATIDNVSVDSATVSFVRGDHLFTYGPRNTTAGKNRFKETASITHNNSDLDNLGYGAIDDQFITALDSSININSTHTIPENSTGLIEIYLDDVIVNIAEVEKLDVRVSLYPNPASESITISVNSRNSEVLSMQLLSLTGTEVQQLKASVIAGDNEINMNTRSLKNGVYILVVKNGFTSISKKLIIHRN